MSQDDRITELIRSIVAADPPSSSRERYQYDSDDESASIASQWADASGYASSDDALEAQYWLDAFSDDDEDEGEQPSLVLRISIDPPERQAPSTAASECRKIQSRLWTRRVTDKRSYITGVPRNKVDSRFLTVPTGSKRRPKKAPPPAAAPSAPLMSTRRILGSRSPT